jgi:hypothetical protein
MQSSPKELCMPVSKARHARKSSTTSERATSAADRFDAALSKDPTVDLLRAQNLRLGVRAEKAEALSAENATLRQQLARAQHELTAMLGLAQQPIDTFRIKPTTSKRIGEATFWLVGSDWHIEESVDAEMVNGLNRYDLAESKRRASMFFSRGLRLFRMFQQDVAIPHVVMPLLGDFISGSIHEDLAESNLLPPADAALRWVEYVASGLELLLAETKKDGTTFYVPCHTGNHGRMTPDRRIQTEAGNSLERMMYSHLAAYFRNEPRVRFNIASSYHSFVECYDTTIRLHHGHNVRYGGGVGGITIPLNKAISQWNRSRPAHLDVIGHFHQFLDGGNFITNGSLIGWSAFAISCKASFEHPKQAAFLIDKKRGKTIVAPVLFNDV